MPCYVGPSHMKGPMKIQIKKEEVIDLDFDFLLSKPTWTWLPKLNWPCLPKPTSLWLFSGYLQIDFANLLYLALNSALPPKKERGGYKK